MSDLGARIHAALQADGTVDPGQCELEVETDPDETVRLRGFVPDLAAKRLVPRAAREVLGHAAISDQLRLKPASPQPDDRLADLLDRALRTEPVFEGTPVARAGEEPIPAPGPRIVVTAEDGVLGLAGEVGSLSHRRLAEAIAWWIPGVCDVDNRLHVVPPEQDDDGEISEALALVLERDPALSAEAVRPRVHDAVVHLEGTVRSREQAERAIHDCWTIAGVHGVRDALSITP
jgi:osmotically-inducible protein OsmY